MSFCFLVYVLMNNVGAEIDCEIYVNINWAVRLSWLFFKMTLKRDIRYNLKVFLRETIVELL